MNWSAGDLRQLRRRLGWSQAEMARCLDCKLNDVVLFESGLAQPSSDQRQKMVRFFNEAEHAAAKIQRSPVAETLMTDRGLAQIPDTEVIACLADGALKSFNFIGK